MRTRVWIGERPVAQTNLAIDNQGYSRGGSVPSGYAGLFLRYADRQVPYREGSRCSFRAQTVLSARLFSFAACPPLLPAGRSRDFGISSMAAKTATKDSRTAARACPMRSRNNIRTLWPPHYPLTEIGVVGQARLLFRARLCLAGEVWGSPALLYLARRVSDISTSLIQTWRASRTSRAGNPPRGEMGAPKKPIPRAALSMRSIPDVFFESHAVLYRKTTQSIAHARYAVLRMR
jgi:hypothetical protein